MQAQVPDSGNIAKREFHLVKWALNIIRKILVTLKSSMPLLGMDDFMNGNPLLGQSLLWLSEFTSGCILSPDVPMPFLFQ